FGELKPAEIKLLIEAPAGRTICCGPTACDDLRMAFHDPRNDPRKADEKWGRPYGLLLRLTQPGSLARTGSVSLGLVAEGWTRTLRSVFIPVLVESCRQTPPRKVVAGSARMLIRLRSKL